MKAKDQVTGMTYANRGQVSKWRITDLSVFNRARESCSSLPPASGCWLELHWTAIQILDLHNYSSGVTYGETFFCLEYEGTKFAELTYCSAKNYVPQYWKRADGQEYWQ